MANKPRKPQGALDWNEKQIAKVLKTSGYVLGFPKIDGCRIIMRVEPYSLGKLSLRSRSGKNFPALKEFEQKLNKNTRGFKSLSSDYPVEYEGEITIINNATGVDLPCEETSGILQRLEQVNPVDIRIRFFDRIEEGYEHHWYIHRLTELQSMRVDLDYLMFTVGANAKVMSATKLRFEGEISAHYECMRKAGYEGGIYRDPMSPVRSGKVLGMWKRKPHETQDGIITGLIEAEDEQGNPKAMIGSLIIQYEDGTTGKAGAGALTHDQRRHFWEHPHLIKGRYCEVKMMEETGKGGKRHPNFYVFRDTEDNKGVKV